MLGARADAGAVATYYGSVPKQQEKLEGICPVLSSYGGRDMLYRGRRGKLIEHLRALGVPHDTKVYPNVGHGFMSQRRGVSTAPGLPPFRAGYDEDAVRLFSESCTRFLVEVPRAHATAFEEALGDIPFAPMGSVLDEPFLHVRGVRGASVATVPIEELRGAFNGGFAG